MANIKLNLWALKESSLKKSNDSTEEKKVNSLKQERKDSETKKELEVNQQSIAEQKQKNTVEGKKEVVPLYKREKKDPVLNIVNEKLSLDKKEDEEKEVKQNLSNGIWEDKLQEKVDKQDEKTWDENNWEIFGNYESELKKRKNTIMSRIRKARNYIKPKTRLGFVFMLIFITFLWIVSLFIINPEVHNFKNYKANILTIKGKIECKLEETKCKNKKEIVKKVPKIENKTLYKYWIKINYKIKTIWSKKIYILESKEYSENDFNNKIIEIIDRIKTEKLKEYLQENSENDLPKDLRRN